MQDGTSLPLAPLGVTRGQTTCRTGQAFPWHPSRGNQGTGYMQDETSLPLAPLFWKPGDRLQAGRDKPSPSTPLGETRRQTTCRTGQAFPWHPSRGNQETDYIQDETSLPLAPLSGEPGDRLQAGQDKPSPGTPLRETRGQTTCRTGQAFPWHPSQGNQGTGYMQDETSLPLAPLSG